MNSSVNLSWQALRTDCRIMWNQNFSELWVNDSERRRCRLARRQVTVMTAIAQHEEGKGRCRCQ
jgi:hypothetical protein